MEVAEDNGIEEALEGHSEGLDDVEREHLALTRDLGNESMQQTWQPAADEGEDVDTLFAHHTAVGRLGFL